MPPHVVNLLVILVLVSSISSHSSIPASSQISEKPDMIIVNANIISMEVGDPIFSYIEVTNGMISKVEIDISPDYLSDPDVQKLDLEGNTLLPGFIDSHSHWFGDASIFGISREEAVDIAISHGWTTITELFANQERIDHATDLDENNVLKPRINMYLPLSYQEQRFGDWYQAHTPGSMVSNKVRIAGIKLFMDGGPFVGYEGRSYYFTPEELNPMIKTAHDLGFQIAIHSIVDNATDMALDAISEAQGDNSAGLYRHRLEHSIMLRDDQISRLNSMNMIVSGQLLWMTSDWIDDLEAEEGYEEYLDLLSRWRDVIDAEIPFIGSTDAPYGIPEEVLYQGSTSISAIYRSVTRMGLKNLVPPDYMSSQIITVEEALRSITIDAAYGSFEENVKGSIKVGKYADFTVLDQDPLSIDLEDIITTNNILTIVDGEVIYCALTVSQQCFEVSDYSTMATSNSVNSRSSGVSLPSQLLTISNFTLLLAMVIYYKKRKFE